jgi:hypothetical protein
MVEQQTFNLLVQGSTPWRPTSGLYRSGCCLTSAPRLMGSGHGTASPWSLRQHMHAAIGVAPLAYRRTFQAAD